MPPFDGNGTFSYTVTTIAPDATAGTTISSTDQDTFTADLKTALSTCITKDGQTSIAANLKMNGFKHTGAAAGASAGDYSTIDGNETLTGDKTLSGAVVLSGSSDLTGTWGIGGAQVTATAAELNLTDNLTATTAELSLMDGDEGQSTVTLADTDGVVINDGTTMKKCLVSDFATYILSGLKIKIFDLGTWDLTATVSSTPVAHGLTYADIRQVTAFIRNDSGASFDFAATCFGTTSEDGYISVSAANIILRRPNSCWFNDANFSNTGSSRGYIVVHYVS